jgi:hypothetical protein
MARGARRAAKGELVWLRSSSRAGSQRLWVRASSPRGAARSLEAQIFIEAAPDP